MSKDKMIIPTNIVVGYQKRSDTYTGKLGYVVYKDAKGVLRKESSWKSWRDTNIEPTSFDNIPTSGFVLNKKVGETRYGWNPRMAWVRIYDPRGFEFEITVANLLFILEETSSVKGKGLEGEFVYSWDKADLVLLPVTSQEYVECSNFTSLQTKKVTKDMIKEGRVYINKQKQKVLYLGRHKYYEFKYNYNNGKTQTSKTVHIFYIYDDKTGYKSTKYWAQSGFTNLAEMVSEETATDFVEKYEEFKSSIYGSKIVEFKFEKTDNIITKKLPEYNWGTYSTIIKHKDDYLRVNFTRYNKKIVIDNYYQHKVEVDFSEKSEASYKLSNTDIRIYGDYYSFHERYDNQPDGLIESLEFYKIVGILDNGKTIDISI